MPKVVIELPSGVRREFVELQVRRAIEAEMARLAFVEDVAKKLNLDEEDLEEIEALREEAWREFKRELGLG
ncbi:hypothetical protein [Thermococcus sp. JdF3]|uniref:hypothetical protein n=1 Tax=Thermococcus sp. JdF3 TaxID=1638258 RepID=UPI0014399BFB|nr:hypothetical protein [Thermococcus sp. JdF3]NJE02493.1 hypothetical protein [Thermococcus sp. JdF3]